MALSDKNILITPNRSQTADPKIEFVGASSTLGPQTITLRVYPTSSGTVSLEGSAGQLFSVTNTLTGTIYSVNDVSGIPSIEVLDTGLVKFAQYSGNVLIGTGIDYGNGKVQLQGSFRAGSGWNTTPASTYFSHTLSAVSGAGNRVVNFDGNGNTPSVWWTSGSRAYGAIDAGDPGLTFWANNGSSWQKQISLGYGTVNVDTTLQQGGNQVLHAGNYNSYAPTLTGGNASGTWTINITGNAATINSQANSATITASTGVNANDIVRRDGSGYIYANHVNFNTGVENPAIANFITDNGDGWSRKSSLDHVKNSIRGVANGTWSINVTGTAGSISGFNNPTISATADTIVYRDGGGHITGNYIFGVYLNASGGNSENPTIGQFWTQDTSDNYLRKSTPAHVINQLGLLTTSNYSSYALPLSGGTVTGSTYFRSNPGSNVYLGSTSSPPLQAYSTDAGAAYMSFHRGSYYAVNFGLDPDNVLRIGGWSAAANRWQLDMSGNTTIPGRATENAWTTSARNYSNEWIEFPNHTGLYSPLNNAHFYPSNGSYGSWRSAGSRGGWAGIEFDGSNGNVSLMINPDSNTSGFHNNSYGWQWRWNNGTVYINKNAYGAGTQATALDSSNYNSYSPTLTGGSASGTWNINITGNAATATSAVTATSASNAAYATTAGSVSSVAASAITGQTGMWVSANRPGPYRLYRRDDDSNYSVQTYWTGSYWRLYGYSGDSGHADTHVGYADNSGYATSAGTASTATDSTKVPLTGGTMTGTLFINSKLRVNTANQPSDNAYGTATDIPLLVAGSTRTQSTFLIENFSNSSLEYPVIVIRRTLPPSATRFGAMIRFADKDSNNNEMSSEIFTFNRTTYQELRISASGAGGEVILSANGLTNTRIGENYAVYLKGANYSVTTPGALDIDCRQSNYFTKTIAGDSTFTFSNVTSLSGFTLAYSFTLEVTHTSGTITWPSTVKWPGNIAPTLTTGKTHLFMFVTDDAGSRWRGSYLTNYDN